MSEDTGGIAALEGVEQILREVERQIGAKGWDQWSVLARVVDHDGTAMVESFPGWLEMQRMFEDDNPHRLLDSLHRTVHRAPNLVPLPDGMVGLVLVAES